MKKIILGVCSSIAAIKIYDLIKSLQKEQIQVQVICTKNALNFVSIPALEELTGAKVLSELFESGFDWDSILQNRHIEHIKLAREADLIVVVPATANFLGKVANGIADDYLTTVLLAASSSVMIFPAMNTNMWQHPAVVSNVKRLRAYGYQVIDPDQGVLACGEEGDGRLPKIQNIKTAILEQLKQSHILLGKRVIVTSAATRERLDQVRFLTNGSSGKMGVALAEQSYLMGANVLLLRGKGSVMPRFGIQTLEFETIKELEGYIAAEVVSCDYFLHTAAVGDFVFESSYPGKLDSGRELTLKLKRTNKIIDHIKQINPSVKLVGFKAEYAVSDESLIKKARARLTDSRADMIVANDVGSKETEFGSDNNKVILVKKNSVFKVPLDSKTSIARTILEHLLQAEKAAP